MIPLVTSVVAAAIVAAAQTRSLHRSSIAPSAGAFVGRLTAVAVVFAYAARVHALPAACAAWAITYGAAVVRLARSHP